MNHHKFNLQIIKMHRKKNLQHSGTKLKQNLSEENKYKNTKNREKIDSVI